MDKYNIIHNYSKGEFSSFLEQDHEGLILQVLDEEGLEILKKEEYASDKIRYILTFSKYTKELFNNPMFIKLFFSTNISDYYASLSQLDLNECKNLMDYATNNHLENHEVVNLFSYFDTDIQIKMLEHWPYNIDLIYIIFNMCTNTLGPYILEHYNIDFDSHNISLAKLFRNGKEMYLKSQSTNFLSGKPSPELHIPDDVITKELLNKEWERLDIFSFREMINDAAYSTDNTKIEKFCEQKEESILYGIDKNGMINEYSKIYELVEQLINDSNDLEKSENDLLNVLSYFKSSRNPSLNSLYIKHYDDICDNPKKIIDLLNKLNNEQMSNYIIDYLFKENYYNIMRDIRELMNFYYEGNIDLPKNRLYFYGQIEHIDELPYESKMELFQYGKGMNVVENFYDDMRFARTIVASALKDSALSRKELDQYLDQTLTAKYGVPVYNIKNNPFFALVKSNDHIMEKAPTGYSYSIIGNGCIGTFASPDEATTYLYDGSIINPEQVVHVYPTDSYTLYKPFEYNSKATRRVSTLLMPDELCNETQGYNEVLILEQGRKTTDIDKRIPNMERIAIYCLNEITNKHVEEAKRNNVGIFLVDSSNYNLGISKEEGNYRHSSLIDNYMEYNYYSAYESRNETHR